MSPYQYQQPQYQYQGQYQQTSVQQQSSDKPNVPEDPRAKVMYYLRTVDSMINYGFPDYLKQYDRYQQIGFDDVQKLISFAQIFSIEVLTQLKVFMPVDDYAMNSDNQFYDIRDTRINFVGNQDIFIGGRNVRIVEVMCFKRLWAVRNFYTPVQMLRQMQRPSANPPRAQRDIYHEVTHPPESKSGVCNVM